MLAQDWHLSSASVLVVLEEVHEEPPGPKTRHARPVGAMGPGFCSDSLCWNGKWQESPMKH